MTQTDQDLKNMTPQQRKASQQVLDKLISTHGKDGVVKELQKAFKPFNAQPKQSLISKAVNTGINSIIMEYQEEMSKELTDDQVRRYVNVLKVKLGRTPTAAELIVYHNEQQEEET